ncbi:hypothetical protein J6590_032693 [Homalodisca vitripennis]|nr:hypothetical protein J6590_032693 [Homalodisca vitripennis]
MGEMKNLDWTVETQVSEQNTPLGQLTFTNIVARLNPSADRYLVLACHYDSKKMHEGAFLGATDSAVPCAMMIDLAYALQDSLEQFKKSELSLMFVFFDGEEAFVEWGPDDSIYGARSLANMWEQNKYPEITSSTDHLDRMFYMVRVPTTRIASTISPSLLALHLPVKFTTLLERPVDVRDVARFRPLKQYSESLMQNSRELNKLTQSLSGNLQSTSVK